MAVSEINCENILDEERGSQKPETVMDKQRRLRLNLVDSSTGANEKKRPWAGLFLLIANPKAVDGAWSKSSLQNVVLDILICFPLLQIPMVIRKGT